jgi:hypothetical protein
MRTWSLFAVILFTSGGCDLLFQIDRTGQAKPDALLPDALLPDAASFLVCSGGKITLRPTARVTTAWELQAPPGSAAVDDVSEVVSDGDATYIASKRDGAYDLFSHLPVSDATNVDSVVVWARARVEAPPGFSELGVAMFSGTAQPYDDRPVTTSYNDYSGRVYSAEPSTNTRWTATALNAMTFGVRKSYADVTARVTQIWAVVACH